MASGGRPPALLPMAGKDDREIAARVALAAAGVAGDPVIAIEVRAHGGASRVVEAVHDHRDDLVPLSGGVRRRILTYGTTSRVARILDASAQLGLSLLTPQDEAWPGQIDALGDAAPLALWGQGDLSLLRAPSVALCGTESPHGREKQMLLELATALSSRGWLLVSGSVGCFNTLVSRSAEVMARPHVVVSPIGLNGQSHESELRLVVSEIPPIQAPLGSCHRTKLLAAALAEKVIVDESSASPRDYLVLQVAASMGRPVGLLSSGAAGVIGGRHPESWRMWPRVRTIRDAELLHRSPGAPNARK